MMTQVRIINRTTKQEENEQIPWKGILTFLYGNNPLGWLVRPLLCRVPFFSKWFGKLQKKPKSKKNILPFIEKYNIDASEFLDPPTSFASFNDFFIRKLKPSARPILDGNDQAIMPADGRCLAYQDMAHASGFFVKGKKFSLSQLLQDDNLAHKYAQGSLLMVRLAPVDYHRFHFPCNCIPSETKLINGPLYSVNPIALKKNIEILAENKRMITSLKTPHFGTILYIEVGATYVGSIIQTFDPNTHYAKGDEKGYFSFGGSCVILIFEPFRIQFDRDLLDNSHEGLETYVRLGQSLGHALN